jgi:hypothetical protein
MERPTPHERLVSFAVQHKVCVGEIEIDSHVDSDGEGTIIARCPGCGATHQETIDRDALESHVLASARLAGFTGTIDDLRSQHNADPAGYERWFLRSPGVQESLIVQWLNARQNETKN